MAKFNIEAFVDDNEDGRISERRARLKRQLDGKSVVLRNDKAWLDEHTPSLRAHPAYLAECFYIAYPDDEREKTLGLVSRISDDPPMLNWLYVDKDTLEVKYGNRSQSRAHHVGNWDWTTSDGKSTNMEGQDVAEGDDGVGIVFESFEGFVAVEEEDGEWALYFDRNDDGLKSQDEKLKGKRKVNVLLERKLIEKENEENKPKQTSETLRTVNTGSR